MAYTFDNLFAADPSNAQNVASNAAILIFDPADAGKAPVTLTDVTGAALPNPITVNKNGFGPAFVHATLDRLAWFGGGFSNFITSYEGMKLVATEAATDAQAAQAAATSAAADAAASAIAPTDAQVDAGVIRANIPALVAEAVGADPAPANAAAAAVSGAMAAQNLSWTLVEGTGAGDTALTTVRGTPSYATAGKFAQGETGAVLRYAGLPAATGDYTAEIWVKRTTGIPGINTALLYTPFGYIGMATGTGQAFFSDPANKAGPALTDSAWHHIAIVVSVLAGTARTFQGLWVDGVKVINATAQTLTSAWTGDVIVGGLLGTGADNTSSIFDEVRISHIANDYYTQAGTGARYSGTFTPPAEQFTWDASTRFLAHLESATAQVVSSGYPTRPLNAPAGAVTYIGIASPAGMLTRDRWIQA